MGPWYVTSADRGANRERRSKQQRKKNNGNYGTNNGNYNGTYGNNNNGGNGATSGAGLVGNVQVATVPQYWIADADIFAGSVAHTASVMAGEGHVNIESPQILQSQAQYMVNCINRASRDLAGIDANAVKTYPNAVPAVREAQAQLQAAVGDANQLAQALGAGGIGPTYEVTLKSAAGHLQSAVQGRQNVARAYPGSPGVQSLNYNFSTASIRLALRTRPMAAPATPEHMERQTAVERETAVERALVPRTAPAVVATVEVR